MNTDIYTAADGPMKGKEVDMSNSIYVLWEIKDGKTVFYDYKFDHEKKELHFLKQSEPK